MDLDRGGNRIRRAQNLQVRVSKGKSAGIPSGRVPGKSGDESLFQEGVEENGEYYYQFLPEALWNVFLPSLEHIWMKSEDNANVFYLPSVEMK